MNKCKITFAAFSFFLIGFVQIIAGDILFNGDKPGIEINVLSSGPESTTLEFIFLGYSQEEIQINGQTYLSLTSPGLVSMMEKGYPNLLMLRKSLIISDDKAVNFRILSEETEIISTLPIAPSKGHFTRNINPNDVPYTFADIYSSNEWYPQNSVEINEPYILRELRGTTIQFNPLKYNDALGQLKVYKRLIVEVYNDSSLPAENILYRKSNDLSKEFSTLYQNHFINYTERSIEYDDLGETGRLLIIYHQNYASEVIPFYNWKVATGFNPVLAEYPSDIGSGSTAIKNYIQDLYDEPEGLLYIILIGESDEIPTMSGNYEGAPSDPCYVKLAGSDAYPDAYISRISVTSTGNCEYVLDKIMTYGGAGGNKTNDWYFKGTGVASNEGSPPDYDRAEWLREMLMDDMGFTEVDQIYDPGATASEVATALNDGRSILNYIGHGSGTSWGTTGFGVSNINNLSNGYMNPFIIDVACLNGDFTMGTCMEEAWIRAGDFNDPKGAIAVYGSSTNASWVPPCDMQNHGVELLTQYQKMTVGGVCFNGLMYAMDLWGGSSGEGLKLMEQFNIFGDCSTYIIFSATPDDVPPTQITDLDVQNIASSSYELTWTAPDDATLNGVVAYDVRSSDSPINTDADFNNADPVTSGPPSPAGTTEILVVDNLGFNETKYYAIKSSDMWGNTSLLSNTIGATTLGAPDMEVNPTSIAYDNVEVGETFSDLVTISNISQVVSTLDFEAVLENNTFPMGAVRGQLIAKTTNSTNKNKTEKGASKLVGGATIMRSGGPDAGGYLWRDSDDPDGPSYSWTDISTTGTLVFFDNGNLDDGWTNWIGIGFTFEYYESNTNVLQISTNGFISFEALSNSQRSNKEIPVGTDPNRILAPFWDDLDLRNQGQVFYKAETDKFTIQFDQVQKYYDIGNGGTSGSYTFQVVLMSNGVVKFLYKEMIGDCDEATVGIENADGTIGCQVAYNSQYPTSNECALQFMKEPNWIGSEDLGSARLYNGNSIDIQLDFDATGLVEGEYNMDLVITSNDPNKSVVTVPITMIVFDPVPVEMLSFTAQVKDQVVTLNWETATETNNKGFEIERSKTNTSKNESDKWTSLGFVEGSGTRSERKTYSFTDNLAGIIRSNVSYRLKQIDYDGTFNYSQVIELEVLPSVYSLEQNYPNPFNPVTTIRFALPYSSDVKLTVYNSLGEVIAELAKGVKESGYHDLEWNAENVPSGIYIYRLEAKSIDNTSVFSDVKKMILLK